MRQRFYNFLLVFILPSAASAAGLNVELDPKVKENGTAYCEWAINSTKAVVAGEGNVKLEPNLYSLLPAMEEGGLTEAEAEIHIGNMGVIFDLLKARFGQDYKEQLRTFGDKGQFRPGFAGCVLGKDCNFKAHNQNFGSYPRFVATQVKVAMKMNEVNSVVADALSEINNIDGNLLIYVEGSPQEYTVPKYDFNQIVYIKAKPYSSASPEALEESGAFYAQLFRALHEANDYQDLHLWILENITKVFGDKPVVEHPLFRKHFAMFIPENGQVTVKLDSTFAIHWSFSRSLYLASMVHKWHVQFKGISVGFSPETMKPVLKRIEANYKKQLADFLRRHAPRLSDRGIDLQDEDGLWKLAEDMFKKNPLL